MDYIFQETAKYLQSKKPNTRIVRQLLSGLNDSPAFIWKDLRIKYLPSFTDKVKKEIISFVTSNTKRSEETKQEVLITLCNRNTESDEVRFYLSYNLCKAPEKINDSILSKVLRKMYKDPVPEVRTEILHLVSKYYLLLPDKVRLQIMKYFAKASDNNTLVKIELAHVIGNHYKNLTKESPIDWRKTLETLANDANPIVASWTMHAAYEYYDNLDGLGSFILAIGESTEIHWHLPLIANKYREKIRSRE